MAKNRFEQVDEKQDDAITLSLRKDGDNAVGTVTCPAALTGGKLPSDMTSGKVPAKDAFRAAIRMGNEMKAPVVVMDPDAVWEGDWGELYRPI